MANETYYSLLGIAETATTAQIKTAYLALIREVHPDRIANAPAYWQRQAEEKCKEINEAYAVLSSDEKRRLYDAELASCRGYGATARRTAAEPPDPSPPSSTQQHQASSSAPSRNDNGTRANDFPVRGVVGCLGILVLVVAAMYISQQGSGNTPASQTSKQPPTDSWRYTKSTDEMTGKVSSQTACLFSENKFSGDESELCSYNGWYYPAVLKVGRNVSIADQGLEYFDPRVPGSTELIERMRCNIRMRVDDKPVFQVCWKQDTGNSEVDLYDSPYEEGRGIQIKTMLKKAKIIKIELVYSPTPAGGTQIFTFKPDEPLDSKW